jgi:hypothetical protein
MQRKLNFVLAVVSILSMLSLASAAFADTVKTDYDHSANFERYHTYSWGAVKADPLWVDRIKQAVDTQLQAKGWQLVPSGGDAVVFATGNVKSQKQLQTVYDGFGPGWGAGWGWGGWGWGGPGFATTTETEQPVGNVVIDIFDASTKKLIWRGMSQRDLSNKTSKNIEALNKDVEKMFKDFPPKSKS